MIIVTGGAGFVGSNLVKKLNKNGFRDIIIVDDLNDIDKMNNLLGIEFFDFVDYEDFFANISLFKRDVEAVFHQGACTDTTVTDFKYVMRVNFQYSKKLLKLAEDNQCSFIYASSASVYGMGENGFSEDRNCENPINFYAFSKFMFDQYVRSKSQDQRIQVVGLRYFNVYGPGEKHKLGMASTAFQFYNQLKENKKIKLFEGTDGYQNGEQKRDFIYVEDVVDINYWFLQNKNISGIYNVGTGVSRSFNELANIIINFQNFGEKEYIKFPKNLIGKYQSFTEADLAKLHSVGYKKEFTSLELGLENYSNYLNKL